jgi:quinol monooxygenase YgiN
MGTNDSCVTIVPYFKVKDGKMNEFKDLCRRFVDKTKPEPLCLFYGFSFNGNLVHCREGYKNAEGLLKHLDNVSDLVKESSLYADTEILEVHGAESELAKLRKPLEGMKPQFFVLEMGFRN